MKNSTFARFTRTLIVSVHFSAVFVKSTTWNENNNCLVVIRVKEPGTSKYLVFTWPLTDIFFPLHMVWISAVGKLRMRKLNTKRAAPLDVVPGQRCSPRFRPGDRFCELGFRYLSPGSEGEISRPLDHLWQIPFVNSTQLKIRDNFCIYATMF